jgi:hypothetical protein
MSKYNLSLIPDFLNMINNLDDKNNNNILKLNKLECRTNNSIYNMIRYDKTLLNYDLIESYGLARSIIINSNNKIVSFAPPKFLKPDIFMKKYNLDNYTIRAEEFVEGTMINVFFDNTLEISGSWEISTRNIVGATCSFYKSKKTKTFRDMFIEALKESKLELQQLDKNYCYSFVLKHPENRIVIPCKIPELYIVGIYNIEYDNLNNPSVNFYDIYDFKDIFNNIIKCKVKFPLIYNENSYTNLINKYASMNTSYDIMGVVLYNKNTGEHSKIRNPVYEQVKLLKGNQPKLQYLYLNLRNQGKVKDYLNYYPENKIDFLDYRNQVHLFTNTLYNNYKSCFIKKEKKLNDYSLQYKIHMYNLHQLYLRDLLEKKLYIDKKFVEKYINELQPSLLMYSLNYNNRKRNIDEI